MSQDYTKYKKFRANVRLLRLQYELSACEASIQIGLKARHKMTNIELGIINPKREEISAIARFFNRSEDDLLNKTAEIIFI